jgi:hypothetical protein
MNSAQKNDVIKALCTMNLGLLDVCLSEHYTYFGLKKALFLSKMSAVFDKFRQHNDVELIPSKRTCTHRPEGCVYVSFCGNRSNLFLDLIFEEDPNEIINIKSCSSRIDCAELAAPHDQKKTIELHIYDDEFANFKPNEKYLLNSSACYSSMAEIRNHSEIQKIALFRNWVEKHRRLYNAIQFDFSCHYKSYNEYFNAYSEIACLSFLMDKKSEIEQATKEYDNINRDDENSLLKWMAKYEYINCKYFSNVKDKFLTDEDLKTGYFNLILCRICVDDFRFAFPFFRAFNSNYPLYFKKVYCGQ